MGRIAVFGGTFDPIHQGHLAIAEATRRQADLEEVIWVPTYDPVYKQRSRPAPYYHRLCMVKQAIAPFHPSFTVSDIEARCPNPSYAVHTFLGLQPQYPHHQWCWLMGLDAFQSLPRWYGRQHFVENCQWLIVPRQMSAARVPAIACPDNTQDPNDFQQAITACERVEQEMAQQHLHIRWQLLTVPPMAVSSSLVRWRCQTGQPIGDLIPRSTRHYIEVHRLYQDFAESGSMDS